MAGQKRTRARAAGTILTPLDDRNQARTREDRSVVFRELLRTGAAQDIYPSIRTGVSTAEALQMCLDRAVEVWRFAVAASDRYAVELDPESDMPQGFFELAPSVNDPSRTIPNKWYTLERNAREDVTKIAALMTQLGIAERAVRVQEAQAALLAAAVRDAAIEAGCTAEQVRAIGEGLRHRADPESSATRPPTLPNGSPTPDGAPPHETPQQRSQSSSLAVSRSQSAQTARAVASAGPGHGSDSS